MTLYVRALYIHVYSQRPKPRWPNGQWPNTFIYPVELYNCRIWYKKFGHLATRSGQIKKVG